MAELWWSYRPFSLSLSGLLSSRPLGYFWSGFVFGLDFIGVIVSRRIYCLLLEYVYLFNFMGQYREWQGGVILAP